MEFDMKFYSFFSLFLKEIIKTIITGVPILVKTIEPNKK
jgi:hypothetical protein